MALRLLQKCQMLYKDIIWLLANILKVRSDGASKLAQVTNTF